MSTTTTRIVGKFVWHELATPDPAASQSFYGGLFGWTFKNVSDGDFGYHLVMIDGADSAGMWPIDAAHAEKVTPHWGGYVSVEDVDAIAKVAAEAGGTIVAGPYDIPNAGRMVVLQDPTGATLTAYRDGGADRADRMPTGGEFCHDDLWTTDVEAAKTFYNKVFGWTAKAFSPDSDDIGAFFRPDGQMAASLEKAPPGRPSHWASYVLVENLEISRARAVELGGVIVAADVSVPGIGRYSVLEDPAGAYFRIFQSNKGA